MTKTEYRQAVRKAQRVLGFIQITDSRQRGFRLSKAKALTLIQTVPDDEPINAKWMSEDQEFLVVG